MRFGLSAGASSGRRSFAVIAAMAISRAIVLGPMADYGALSGANCNCSEVSDGKEGEEDQKSIRGIDFPTNPKRWARWPAN